MASLVRSSFSPLSFFYFIWTNTYAYTHTSGPNILSHFGKAAYNRTVVATATRSARHCLPMPICRFPLEHTTHHRMDKVWAACKYPRKNRIEKRKKRKKKNAGAKKMKEMFPLANSRDDDGVKWEKAPHRIAHEIYYTVPIGERSLFYVCQNTLINGVCICGKSPLFSVCIYLEDIFAYLLFYMHTYIHLLHRTSHDMYQFGIHMHDDGVSFLRIVIRWCQRRISFIFIFSWLHQTILSWCEWSESCSRHRRRLSRKWVKLRHCLVAAYIIPMKVKMKNIFRKTTTESSIKYKSWKHFIETFLYSFMSERAVFYIFFFPSSVLLHIFNKICVDIFIGLERIVLSVSLRRSCCAR